MTTGPGFAPIRRIDDREPVVSILTSSRALPPGNWHGGVSWRSAAHVGYTRPYCDDSEAQDPAAFTQPQFMPYTIYVPIACEWIIPGDDTDLRDEGIAAVEAVTAWHVARNIWNGPDSLGTPSLKSVATDESAADPVHPVTALGTLLEAYEDCAQAGGAVVHAPTATVVSLLSHGVIRQNGDHYVGPNGTIVSPGPGYPTAAADTGPDDADDDDAGTGNVWMYVTGPVEVALDPVAIPLGIAEAAFDRRTNRYEFTAQRMAIHRFDPECAFAVRAYVPSPAKEEST